MPLTRRGKKPLGSSGECGMWRYCAIERLGWLRRRSIRIDLLMSRGTVGVRGLGGWRYPGCQLLVTWDKCRIRLTYQFHDFHAIEAPSQSYANIPTTSYTYHVVHHRISNGRAVNLHRLPEDIEYSPEVIDPMTDLRGDEFGIEGCTEFRDKSVRNGRACALMRFESFTGDRVGKVVRTGGGRSHQGCEDLTEG